MHTKQTREYIPVSDIVPNTPATWLYTEWTDSTGRYYMLSDWIKHYLSEWWINENTITSITFSSINSVYDTLDLKDWQGYIKANLSSTWDEWRITIWYTSNTESKKFFINWTEIAPNTLTNTQATIEQFLNPDYRPFIVYWLNEIEIFIWSKSFKYFLFLQSAWNMRWMLTLEERFDKYNKKTFEVKDTDYTLKSFDNILYFNMTANRVLTLDYYYIYADALDTTISNFDIYTGGNYNLTINTTWTDRLVYNWIETNTITLEKNEYINLKPLKTWKILVNRNIPTTTTTKLQITSWNINLASYTWDLYINVNPATAQDWQIITMPTTPTDKQKIEFIFWWTILSNLPVATNLSFVWDLYEDYTWQNWIGGERLVLQYDNITAKWMQV